MFEHHQKKNSLMFDGHRKTSNTIVQITKQNKTKFQVAWGIYKH